MKSDLLQLCHKYQGRLPRYTSYPTALEFKPLDNNKIIIDRLKKITDDEGISLYIHLPYCPELCYFCACNKEITKDQSKNSTYLEFLETEIKLLKKILSNNVPVNQIHLGGGSPSYLTEIELEKLEEMLVRNFNISPNCQRSIEVDPRSFSKMKAKALKDLNYQRVSLGVQDFDEKVQVLINRVQPYELTKQTLEYVKEYKFEGINFDLIYGLPSQTIESFKDTILKVIDLKPDRIALYGYAHVNWKVKVQAVFNKYPLPTPSKRIELFEMAVNLLIQAGYIYIGMDHFALPDDELTKALNTRALRRNFMGYTTIYGKYLIGLGASSISDLGDYIYQNEVKVEEYQKIVANEILPIKKFITRSEDDKIRSFIIERLMCDRYLSLTMLESEFPKNLTILEIFNSGLEKLKCFLDDDFVILTDQDITITKLGSFFMRNIVSVFDTYIENVDTTKPSFSQSV